VRKLGELPGLTRKISNNKILPGQHGQLRSKLLKNMSPYALRLLEKQKLRFNNITERQLLRCYVLNQKKIMVQLVSFASTFRNAVRQYCLSFRYGTNCRCSSIVGHGHIFSESKQS
jgi:small subunit ribosomal protein S4